MTQILNIKKMLVLALLLKMAPVLACEVREEHPKLTSLAVSVRGNKSSYVFAGNPKETNLGLFVSKCKGGYLQLAQGVNVASPADYSGLTFLRKDLAKTIRCESRRGQENPQDLKVLKVAEGQLKISYQCVGMVVEGRKGTQLNLLDNKQCQIVKTDVANGKVILQGDNCVIEANQENFMVTPTVLPSCFENLNALTSVTKEVDMSLAIFHKKSLEENMAHDELVSKPVRLVVSEDPLVSKLVSTSRLSPQGFDLYKSSSYDLKVSFGNLKLVGTPDTGIQATANYFLDTTGNRPGNAYRIPFVMKNELYLVKRNAEPQIIGNWFTGSVVSSQWQGLDGEPSFNKLFQGPPFAQLKSGAKLIQKGDKLVLVSRLQSPNSGPKKLAAYMANLLINIKKLKAEKAALNFNLNDSLGEIPSFDELQAFESIEEIQGFTSLSIFEKGILRDWSKQWPVVFRNICVNGHCGSLDELSETLVMETMYEVEKDDFELKIRPLRQIEKWNDQRTLDRNKNIENEVKCL